MSPPSSREIIDVVSWRPEGFAPPRSDAVIRVLATADKPLRAREIHAAAQELAGMPLSWNTVKDCLHKNARRLDSPIERVGHGRYLYPGRG
jgi:hypothetical protein